MSTTSGKRQSAPPTKILPHDLPPSSRSPSPSRQGAIFESQRSSTVHALSSTPKSSSSSPTTSSSMTVRRPRYGADERRRNLSVDGDEWVQGLDRVDSPGPPSFGNKAGRGMNKVGSYGGYAQPGEQGEMTEGKAAKMPIVVPKTAVLENKAVVSAAPSIASMDGQVQMKEKKKEHPQRGREQTASSKRNDMPPPRLPIDSSPDKRESTRSGPGRSRPVVHVIHPSTSTTASFAPPPPGSPAKDPAATRPASIRSTGSQQAFADVVKMMQDGRASRDSVVAHPRGEGKVEDAGSGIGGSGSGSVGRPPKQRGGIIGPGGVLASMKSKPSFAKLRELARASKASLTGSYKDQTAHISTTGVGGHPDSAFGGTMAFAEPEKQQTGDQRSTTLLRAAPLPPLRSSSPSERSRFAPPSISPSKALANRSSGLLANVNTGHAARTSADALFAPAIGPTSMRDERTDGTGMHSAAPSPARSDGGWLHNPNVDFGSAPNLPLPMRMSQLRVQGGETGQQYQTPQGQPGAGGLRRSVSVREDGTVEIPRFKRKELNLEMVPHGLGRRMAWVGLWGWCVLWVFAGLFFDVNFLYMLVQCAKSASPASARAGNNAGWVFALAAYAVCMFISIVLVWLAWGVWYEGWRKWRLPQPPIEPIHTSLPATIHLSLSSFPHFCFFLHTRLSMLGTRYASDILPETAALGLQSIPALLPVLPRASIAVILYVTYYARSTGVPLQGDNDAAFWGNNGRLTSYAQGVVLGFMVVSAVRLATALLSGAVIFAFSRSRYNGPSTHSASARRGLRSSSWRHRNRPSLIPLSQTKYEGHGTATSGSSPTKESEGPTTPQRKRKELKRDPSQTLSPSKGWLAESESAWGWRERGRNRLQDAYELCMMRPSRRRFARSIGQGMGVGMSMDSGRGGGTGSPTRDAELGAEEDVEKLASPADSVRYAEGEEGGLLSPTPKRIAFSSQANVGQVQGEAMSPSSKDSAKRSTTPTIRFADEEARTTGNGTRSIPSAAQEQQRLQHVYNSDVNGYHAETAGSTSTLRPEIDPSNPDSGVLPQGRFSPLALADNLPPSMPPSGGMALGVPLPPSLAMNGSSSDPHIAKQPTVSAPTLNGQKPRDRPHTADKSTSTANINTPTKRPLHVAQKEQGQPSKDSLSSHELFYTPMSGTPMPSHESFLGPGTGAGAQVGSESSTEGGHGDDEHEDEDEERLVDGKSGSATPTASCTSANGGFPSSDRATLPHAAATANDTRPGNFVRPNPIEKARAHSRASLGSQTEDESDSAALLAYDDFGYPSYPSARNRKQPKVRSPTKRHYDKDIQGGGGGGSMGVVKRVISSPSLKNLRDRAGSMVGRKPE